MNPSETAGEREIDRTIAARVAAVRERIGSAARRAGRDPARVTIVGASKSATAAAVADAVKAGVIDMGENRAQEMLVKVQELARRDVPVRWHFIGRLQRNKVRDLAPHVCLWHSVDRVALGEVIARHAPGAEVLVEVNTGHEVQKGGCASEEAPRVVDGVRAHGLVVGGLMTVAPLGVEPRRAFATLREIAMSLELAELSMGMSGDFEAAVEEGATLVRVGTALFGPRALPGGLPDSGPPRR